MTVIWGAPGTGHEERELLSCGRQAAEQTAAIRQGFLGTGTVEITGAQRRGTGIAWAVGLALASGWVRSEGSRHTDQGRAPGRGTAGTCHTCAWEDCDQHALGSYLLGAAELKVLDLGG